MKSIRLRYLAEVNPPSPAFEKLGVDEEVTFLPLEAVWPGTKLDTSQRKRKIQVATGYTRFQEGDILVPKITPTFEAGRTVIAAGLLGCVGAGSTELHVLRPRPQINPRFLLYSVSTHSFLKLGEAEMYGVAGQKRVPDEFLRDLPLDCPLLEEQRRIADFLDAETSHMDRMNNLRMAQIRLLEQRSWSYLQSLIDRSRCTEIPLRRAIDSITDGPFGSAFSSNDYTDDGAVVVRLGNIGFAEYRANNHARIPMSMLTKFDRYKVIQGDLLIAALGDAKNHAGRACVAPDLGPAIVKGKCLRARIDPRVADVDFIAILLSSPIGENAIEGHGSTRTMINIEIVKSAILPMPDREEQSRIVQEFRYSWDTTRNTVTACQKQIKLITERRQALITAAVTGQFDVSTASGRGLGVLWNLRIHLILGSSLATFGSRTSLRSVPAMSSLGRLPSSRAPTLRASRTFSRP